MFINDIPQPVFIGLMRGGLPGGADSRIELGQGMGFSGSPPYQYTGETDYIRLMTYTAMETPPLGGSLADGRIMGFVDADDYTGDAQVYLPAVKVELKDGGGSLLATRDLLTGGGFAGGGFTFPFLEQGSYQVVVRGCQWITQVIPVTLGASDVDLGTITLVNGDVDGDGSITTGDLSVTLKN